GNGRFILTRRDYEFADTFTGGVDLLRGVSEVPVDMQPGVRACRVGGKLLDYCHTSVFADLLIVSGEAMDGMVDARQIKDFAQHYGVEFRIRNSGTTDYVEGRQSSRQCRVVVFVNIRS